MFAINTIFSPDLVIRSRNDIFPELLKNNYNINLKVIYQS